LEIDTLVPTFESFYKRNKKVFIKHSEDPEEHFSMGRIISNWKEGKIIIPERELLANMRYKYLMMVKARYHKNAESGLMYPETLVLLDHISKMELDSCML